MMSRSKASWDCAGPSSRSKGEAGQAHLAAPEGLLRLRLGTLRYEVLKRARFRCELCGVSADIRALEVDHIVPRNRGGTDDPDNLQALCYSCNSMKRDRDATDFRKVRETYGRREPGCPFCEMPEDRVIAENELAYAVRDAFPVTVLHTLVIPKRHVSGYFDLGQAELNACHRLLEQEKEAIEHADTSVEGFNVGINEVWTPGRRSSIATYTLSRGARVT